MTDRRPATLGAVCRPQPVRAVAIDRLEAYRGAIPTVLPMAAIVADRFRVVAVGHQALREVRHDHRPSTAIRQLLDWAREPLLSSRRDRLPVALGDDPPLATARVLKQGLRTVYRSPMLAEARARLDGWYTQGGRQQPDPLASEPPARSAGGGPRS